MKKFFLIAVFALLLGSCGNSYIDGYEDICKKNVEIVEGASSIKELMAIMKDFRKEIHDYNDEHPEEAALYMFEDKENKENSEVYKRRLKAYNSVNHVFVKKYHSFKKK